LKTFAVRTVTDAAGCCVLPQTSAPATTPTSTVTPSAIHNFERDGGGGAGCAATRSSGGTGAGDEWIIADIIIGPRT
jgi:hypothetical protein